MPKYEIYISHRSVEVSRHPVKVEAKNKKEAVRKALDWLGDNDWPKMDGIDGHAFVRNFNITPSKHHEEDADVRMNEYPLKEE
jgi:hypothetical protein